MTEITTILDDLRIPYRTSGHKDVRQGWIGLNCPWCDRGPDKFYLGVNLASGYAVCWSCGYKRLGDVLAELSRRPMRECLSLLRGLARPVRASELDRVRGKLIVPRGVAGLQGAHKRYLGARGFNPGQIARLWGVRGIGLAPRLAWRLWLPITEGGEAVSWITRSIGCGDGPRYVTAEPEEESIPARDLLYGADLAGSSVVVVEGPLDAWAIGLGAVSTLGVGWTRAQLVALGRYARRAICFDAGDGERPAERRARELAEELKLLPGETSVISLESAKDPAACLLSEAGRAELKSLRATFLDDRNTGV